MLLLAAEAFHKKLTKLNNLFLLSFLTSIYGMIKQTHVMANHDNPPFDRVKVA
jgi:hypothetical protein